METIGAVQELRNITVSNVIVQAEPILGLLEKVVPFNHSKKLIPNYLVIPSACRRIHLYFVVN